LGSGLAVFPGAPPGLFEIDRFRHAPDRGNAQTASSELGPQPPHNLCFASAAADNAEHSDEISPVADRRRLAVSTQSGVSSRCQGR
jgi:hypothetical protein